MWIFGYGSLMVGGWENGFGCLRRCVAILPGYRRTFNKASVRNWGSKSTPCPTLNIEKDDAAECVGVAFEFPPEKEGEVRKFLDDREGKNFPLKAVSIRVNHDVVSGNVPIYQGTNLVPVKTAQEKAAMVIRASGVEGSGIKYLEQIVELLAEVRIEDPIVSELWQAVQVHRKCDCLKEK